MPRHFIDLLDVSSQDLAALLAETERLKHAKRSPRQLPLAGKVLGMVFEKPSLRTRVSFQSAMAQLGGFSVFMAGSEVGLGTRESVPDIARTTSQYVDGVVLRVFAHATVQSFAASATVPVVNGLSDRHHPCQALADVFTIREALGSIEDRTVAFVGDGNNMARSLALACGKLGLRFVLARPEGYGFDPAFLEECQGQFAPELVRETSSPEQAVAEADVVYTDVWASMGQEDELEARKRAFASFQVNAELIANAPPHAIFMHCLPAHRGEEVTSDVLEGPRSIVFQQAGNRLHAQKALLLWLLSDGRPARKKGAN